jgi:CRISPR/Cas system CSM-associated protein Csm3 (group 7 of RAMP superfamily)
MVKTKHTHRFIARFKIEAETPLFVGSGESSLMTDALVQKDVNGFPMIQGTSLAGVLRHSFGINAEKLFGDKNSEASKLKVSGAYMLLENGKISEGIIDSFSVELKERFDHLPKRQHVRITEKGVAEKHGLFDNEVVYKGTQFVFEIEVRGNEDDVENWNKILELVQSPTFRLGSGTRNGYGKLKVIGAYIRNFDLRKEADFNEYLNFDPSFNNDLKFNKLTSEGNVYQDFTKFSLQLQPDSFFIFSAGFGDDDADNKPIEEDVINYKDDGEIVFEKQTLIPATSIKGAIAHRVAFHFNKLQKAFVGNLEGNVPKVGIENHAVATLFGKAGKQVLDASAGNVFINDFYFKNQEVINKVFNHVAIDRFTGGAMQGALFSEKVTNLLDKNFSFEIYVKTSALSHNVKIAFENTLIDICKGLLPLGGMTTKGHGIFTGSVTDGIEFSYTYPNNED